MHPDKNGFTLIELLVAVLIIGILAAIALPQYRKAVDKTKASRLLPILRAIKNAQESSYLVHGSYSDDWNALDISIPNTLSVKACKVGGHATQCLQTSYATFVLRSNQGYTYVRLNDISVEIGIHFDRLAGKLGGAEIICSATDDRGCAVCKSLGGTKFNANNGVNADYYKIQ
jgi:prepilin-type N-terminal cleavage/methylation domain-containing protein